MRRLALIAAGALLPFSFAPFDFWPAGIAGLALAFWCMRDVHSLRTGLFHGWLIGVGKYAVGASWIYISIHEQGGASEGLASILVGLFVAGMALFSALFGGLYALASKPVVVGGGASGDGALGNLWVFVAAWTLAEWSLTWLLTGFPWLFAGYGLMPTWLVNFAPVVGVLGLTAIACALAGSIVLLLARWRRAIPVTLLVLLPAAGFGLGGSSWVTLGERQEVALVQGNIEQLTKWAPSNRLPIINTYTRLSEPHWGADLIIWPEAAITLFAQQAEPFLARWRERGKGTATTLVLGLPDVEAVGIAPDGAGSELAFQNSAQALGAGSGRYVKRRLVPFGEYVPLESLLRGLIGFFDLPMSRSQSGANDQPPLLAAGTALGMAICYEIAYPELVRTSAARSDVLVTISNDAWFGASIGPHQHLQIARMRALENGRYVLRGTNNGVTAIISERGELLASLPQFEPGVLRGGFHTASGSTPFNRFGHWPLIGLLVLTLALVPGLGAGGILRHLLKK